MQVRVGNRAVAGKDCQPCAFFFLTTFMEGKVSNRAVAGKGC
jgi:hypothetical protein